MCIENPSPDPPLTWGDKRGHIIKCLRLTGVEVKWKGEDFKGDAVSSHPLMIMPMLTLLCECAVNFDQVAVRVAQVRGTDAPIGAIFGFGQEMNAFNLQDFIGLIDIIDAENKCCPILAIGNAGF